MEPKIGRTYLFYKTAKEMWEAMQALYSDMENTAQCFEIRSAIWTTRQGNHSVTEYYNLLNKLWQEMDLFYDISWECIEDEVKYNKMVEKKWMFDFLHGLISDLDGVRERFLGSKPFPSIREAFAKVRREENCKKVMLNSFSTSENNTHNSTLVTSKLKTSPLHSESQRDKEWCDHYHKPYHTRDTC